MNRQKVKVGFAPTRRPTPRFSVEWASRQKALIEAKLEEWGVDYVGIDWLNEEGIMFDPRDAYRVAEYFKAEKVDALFTPHCNFGNEATVAILGREVNKPLLLWGPRDQAPPPAADRCDDVQCGLFGTSKALRRMNVPFTYIVNSPTDSALFERGFHLFLGAAAAANNFLRARVGQIASRPDSFWTVIINESELLERWGIQVVPITMPDVQKMVMGKEKGNRREVQETVAEFLAMADFSQVSEEQINRLAALKLTLVEMCRENGLDALAINCSAPFRTALGVRACFVSGVLADMGIPFGCEGDVHGALTSLLVKGAVLNTKPVLCTDLTIRHPANDDGELLWHCGCFPPSLAVEESKPWVGVDRGSAGTGNWRAKGGDLTLARFDGDHGSYSLFIGEARSTGGPATNWTYLWMEVDDWPKWEEKFIYGPYIHHCAAVHDHVAPVLYEACKYIPGLQPDPLDPSEQEIRAYWRGEDLTNGQ